jgi:hypothetical protein
MLSVCHNKGAAALCGIWAQVRHHRIASHSCLCFALHVWYPQLSLASPPTLRETPSRWAVGYLARICEKGVTCELYKEVLQLTCSGNMYSCEGLDFLLLIFLCFPLHRNVQGGDVCWVAAVKPLM